MNYSTLPLEIEQITEGFVVDLQELYAQLESLEDKRRKRGKRYALALLLLIAILAKLAGQNQIRAIARWAILRQAELSSWLHLPYSRMPHHTTWSRVLGKVVEPQALSRLVSDLLGKGVKGPGEVPNRGSILLAIDGKALRGTIPLGKTQGVHLVAAYLPGEGVVLAQIAVESKENEIVVAPKVLAQLDLRGMVVVGDAMYCQRELSAQVVEHGGDYVWVVKGNQKGVLEDIEILFGKALLPAGCFSEEPTDFQACETVDKGHGRREKRVLTCSTMLAGYTPWPNLAQVFKLESWRWDGNGKVSHLVRYGVTSLPRGVAGPKRLLELVRGEWGIENGLHYRRDVTLQEDYSQLRMGHAPEVNAILNNLVIGLFLQQGVSNLPEARQRFDYLFSRFLFSRKP